MHKKNIALSAITTAAVVAALIVTPTFAAFARSSDAPESGPSMRSSQSQVRGDGAPGSRSSRSQRGPGNMGVGAAQGHGLTDVASGTLTDDQEVALAAMAEEEKLAHDLYVAFDELYDAKAFTRITLAESRHLDAVRTVLERYEVTDPTLNHGVGEFLTADTQVLYDTLFAAGSVSLEAAMESARTVEETDIADLTSATAGVTAPDVLKVYERLLAGSAKHLVAFGG